MAQPLCTFWARQNDPVQGTVVTFRCRPARLSEVSLWGGAGMLWDLRWSLGSRTGACPLARCRLPRGAGRKGAKQLLHGAAAVSPGQRGEPGPPAPAGKAKPAGAGQAAVAEPQTLPGQQSCGEGKGGLSCPSHPAHCRGRSGKGRAGGPAEGGV